MTEASDVELGEREREHERSSGGEVPMVPCQHQWVVWIDQALLLAGLEEVLGVADDELVEWGAGGDEDRDRAGTAARPIYCQVEAMDPG
jgi:hypothetical protein